jgi:hypothetical protein
LEPPPQRTAWRSTRRRPGSRLARVGDARPGSFDGVHESTRQRRDSRKPLGEIESDALGGQDSARVAFDREDCSTLSDVKLCSIRRKYLHARVGVQSAEGEAREVHAAQHAVLACDNGGAGSGAVREQEPGS